MDKPEVVEAVPAGAKVVTPVAAKKKAAATKKKPAPVVGSAAVAAKTALVKRPKAELAADKEVSLFERLALDPNCDVSKLERLIEAHKEIKKVNAEAAFNEAFAKMQQELPIVVKRGLIKVEGVIRSKYARYEDIVEKIRPVLSTNGFSIRHETAQVEGIITVTGVLAHRDGHSVKDTFTTRPDSGGKMNDIQRIGSAISYGKRYTLLSLVGIATAGEDDDGHATGERKKAAEKKTPAPSQANADGKGGEAITEPQRKRLWAIAKGAGRTEPEIKMWLLVVYKTDSTAAIKRTDYDAIVKAIEAKGPLPLPADDREPGSDG